MHRGAERAPAAGAWLCPAAGVHAPSRCCEVPWTRPQSRGTWGSQPSRLGGRAAPPPAGPRFAAHPAALSLGDGESQALTDPAKGSAQLVPAAVDA